MQSEVTRRKLAGIIAASAAAVRSAAQAPQPPALPTNPEEELVAARQQARRFAEQISRVKLPIETEPAAHFRAQ